MGSGLRLTTNSTTPILNFTCIHKNPASTLFEQREAIVNSQPTNPTTFVARKLRREMTKSESLLWEGLRARQLGGLKFRREHPVAPYFLDFACASLKLGVEIDGGYHLLKGQHDLDRAQRLAEAGWRIVRFTAEEVEKETEAVLVAIAKAAGVSNAYKKRQKSGSGALSEQARPAPKPVIRSQNYLG